MHRLLVQTDIRKQKMISSALNFLSGYVFCTALDFEAKRASWVLLGLSVCLAAAARLAR